MCINIIDLDPVNLIAEYASTLNAARLIAMETVFLVAVLITECRFPSAHTCLASLGYEDTERDSNPFLTVH